MPLITVNADFNGVVIELRRIADALDRAAPVPAHLTAPPPVADPDAAPDLYSTPSAGMAESPAEYEARTRASAALAVSLGFAPWSSALEQLILELRQDLRDAGLDEDESEATIREAFAIAKAAANVRA